MDSSTDSPPCHYVVIKRNGMDGKKMQLELNSESVFGSDVDCDVRIRHDSVAAQHARVVVNEKGQVSVVSLVDDAPVSLNNHNVEKESLIKDNDILTVGDRQFRFQYHRKVLSPVNRRTSKALESTPKMPTTPRPPPVQLDAGHADASVHGQENNPIIPEDIQHNLAPKSPMKELTKSPSRPSPGRTPRSPSRKTTPSLSRGTAPSPSREPTPSPSRRSAPSPSRGTTPARSTAPSPAKGTAPSPSRRSTPSLSKGTAPSPSRRSVPSPSREPTPSPSRRSAPSPSRGTTPVPSREFAPSPSRRSTPSPFRGTTSSPSRGSNPSPSRRSATSAMTNSPARKPILVPTPNSAKTAPACETRDVTTLKKDLPIFDLAQTSGSGGSCPSTPEMKTSSRRRTTPGTAPAKLSKPAKRTASPKSLNWSSFGCADSPDDILDANCSTGQPSPAVVHSAKKLGTDESLLIQQEVNSAANMMTRRSQRMSSPFPHGLRSSSFLPTVKSTPNSSVLGGRQHTPMPSSVGESFRSRRSSYTASASPLGSIQETWESPASPTGKMVTPNNALFQESIGAKTRSTKRKSVTFGPQLSPELYDTGLPPNTPLRRGKNPNVHLAQLHSGQQGASRNSLARSSIGVLGESLWIVEEEESYTASSDSQCKIEEESANYSTIVHCPSPVAINLTMPDDQQEEEEVYYESDFEDDSEYVEEADADADAVSEARRTLPTPVRRGIEAKPALRKTKNVMQTPLREAIKQRPKLQSRRNRMPTPLRRAIENRPSLRRVLRRMQTPLRRDIESRRELRKTKQSLPTPLREEIEREPQLRATKRSMPTPVRREIAKGVQLKQTKVQKSMPTPLRKQIESGVELRTTRRAAPTPLRKEIESGVELRKTRKAAPTPLRKQIESGVQLRKTRKAAPTPLRKQIESGVELRRTRKAAPTPLRKQIESGVELRRTRKAAPTPLRKQIESGVELRKTRKAAPTPLRKEIESGVELRKTKRSLHTPLKVAIQQGKQLKNTKRSLPASVRAEIEAQPQLRRTKRSLPADLKMEIQSQPVLKKTLLPEASKKSVQGKKRRVSSTAEDVSTAKRRRVAQSHQKNTVVDDTVLDGLHALFATPKPAQKPFDPSSIVLTPGVFGRVQFISPVSRTAQKKTPSGVSAPKILKAVPLMEMPSEELFVFTAKPVRATRQRKKDVESAKVSSKARAKSARSAANVRPQDKMQTARQTRSGKRKAPDSDATLPVKKACIAQEPDSKVPQSAVRRSTRHAKTGVSEPVVEKSTCSTRRKTADVKPEAVQPPCDVTIRRSTRGKAPALTNTPMELPVTRQTRRKKQSAVAEVPVVTQGKTATLTNAPLELPATRQTRSQSAVAEVPAVTQGKTATLTNAPLELPATRQTRSQSAVAEVPAAHVVASSTRSTRQRKAAAELVCEETLPPAKKRTRGKCGPDEEEKMPSRAKKGASTKTADTPVVRRSARLAKK